MYDLDQSFLTMRDEKKRIEISKDKIPSISCFLINQTCLKAEREITSFLKLNINILSQFGPDSILYFFVSS